MGGGALRAGAVILAGMAALAGGLALHALPARAPDAPLALGASGAETPTEALPSHAPLRVVSMNLCTDQLAMLLAAPGQLHSVSWMAADPRASVLADRAGAYALNHGRAEEIFLMRPDLILAGTFTTRDTVSMLRRLGFRVELFTPESGFADIRANIRRMGDLLGRGVQAEALVAELDARLAAARPGPGEARPLAALRYANAWSSGDGTLAHAILTAAGLRNLGAELGMRGIGRLPLERLVMGDPDLLVAGRPFSPPTLAEQDVRHPALAPLLARAGRAAIADSRWVCGAPFTADAVADLAATRRALADPGAIPRSPAR